MKRRHQGPPRVITDVHAPNALLGDTPIEVPPSDARRDARSRYPKAGRVVCVFGEHARRAVDAVHLESRTPTYVIPEEEADLELAIETARAESSPGLIFVVGRPRDRAGVQALYDGRWVLPGAGLIVRLGPRAGAGVEEAVQVLGLMECYKTVPAETLEDAAIGLIYVVGLSS